MGLVEESMPQWQATRWGPDQEECLALVRASGAVLVVDSEGTAQAVALSLERYQHMARAVIGVSAHLWSAAVDIAAQLQMSAAELGSALGLDEEEFEMCRDVGGVSPLADAGRRAGLLIEVFRLARARYGREGAPRWLHAKDPVLERVPVELMAEFMGLEHLKTHLSATAPA